MTCPFCAIIAHEPSTIRTRWYYVSPACVVLEDENSRGYAERILTVPAQHVRGERWAAIAHEVYGPARAVADAKCLTEGLEIVAEDWFQHSYLEHGHLQICLERKGGNL